MLRLPVIALLASAVLAAPLARAEDDLRLPRNPTPAAFEAGLALAKQDKIELARAMFRVAWERGRLPKALFNLGRCDQLLGHHADAENELRAYRRLPAATPELSEIARKYLAEIEPLVGHVTVDASVDALVIDAKRSPLEALRDPVAVAPGVHAFELRQGAREDKFSAELKAGETLKLPRAPEAIAPPVPPKVAPLPPDPKGPEKPKPAEPQSDFPIARTLVTAGIGLGAVGLAIGGVVTAGDARSHRDAAAASIASLPSYGCNTPSAACSRAQDERAAQDSSRTTSIILYIASGALAAGAVATWLLWPSPRGKTTGIWISPAVAPSAGGVNVVGRF
jgi:hypothetical protein